MPISTMKKLTVLAFGEDTDAIVRKLMKLRCVDIRSTETGDGALLTARFDSDGQKAEAESRLRLIREVIPVLDRYSQRKKKLGRSLHRVNFDEFISSGRAAAAWDAAQKTQQTVERIAELDGEITRLHARAESLTPWLEYDAPLNEEGSEKTVLMLGTLPPKTVFEEVCTDLESLEACCEQVLNEDQSAIYLSVLCHRSVEEEVVRRLAARGFLRTVFRDVDCRASIALDRTEQEIERLSAERLSVNEKLYVLADELTDIEILCDVEQTNANAARHLQKLAMTKKCTVLEGWTPTFTQDAVVEVLERFDCAYELAEPQEGEEPPVLLRNNRFAMTFEWVIGMYAYPKYGAFDPTFIMSIFYFVLFGLMFADVGYGLILTLGCFGGVRLLNPRPGLRRMMYMFGYCGIGSIAMGMILGGWFGDLPTAVMSNILNLPIDSPVGTFFGSGLWFNPLDDPMTFLILSLGMGAVHLITGMVIKFVVLCKEHHAAEAICTIAPFWVLFAGLIMMALGMLGESFAAVASIAPYVALAGAALILLLNGYGRKGIISHLIGGFGGLYGLINYASDLLSYSRVLALGLVAGVIAKVINLITMLGATGAIGLVVMFIILVIGHMLNLAINVLGTFVHTSRLQYIEFFGKFYEDGGKPFEPATEADQYSENL